MWGGGQGFGKCLAEWFWFGGLIPLSFSWWLELKQCRPVAGELAQHRSVLTWGLSMWPVCGASLGFLSAWRLQGSRLLSWHLKALSTSTPVSKAEGKHFTTWPQKSHSVTSAGSVAYWLKHSQKPTQFQGSGNTPHLSMGGLSKNLWICLKTATVDTVFMERQVNGTL